MRTRSVFVKSFQSLLVGLVAGSASLAVAPSVEAQTVAPISVGTEVALDAPVPVVGTTTTNIERAPHVAVCGGVALVGFLDSRDGSTSPGGDTNAIYAVRARASDGTPLDATAIPISRDWSELPDFGIAANGDTFLVAFATRTALFGVRVRAADGVVLDPTPFVIATASGIWPVDISVASDGTNFLVAWTDGRNPGPTRLTSNQDIYVNRVTKDGTVADTAATALATGFDYQAHPRLVWTGSEYVVVFLYAVVSSSNTHLRARRVGSDGTVKSGVTSLVDDLTVGSFEVGYGGGRLLVAFATAILPGDTTPATFRARWFDTSLASIGSEALLQSTSTLYDGPSLAWDGAGFLVSWVSSLGTDSQTGELIAVAAGMRLSPTQGLLDPTPVELSAHWTDSKYPILSGLGALGAGRFLVAAPPNQRVSVRIVNAPFPAATSLDGGTGGDGGSGGGSGGSGIVLCSAAPGRPGSAAGALAMLAVAMLALAWRRARGARRLEGRREARRHECALLHVRSRW